MWTDYKFDPNAHNNENDYWGVINIDHEHAFTPRERALSARIDAFEREELGEYADFDFDLLD